MPNSSELVGPDLSLGLSCAKIADGATLLGHAGGEQVLLVRVGNEFFAVGAYCTHYHGPLAEGLVADGTIRCPWHHACFDLRTGEALQAPAFDPLSCWVVEIRGDCVFVHDKKEQPRKSKSGKSGADEPKRIVIVGGGAAGFAAAEMLRREKFAGEITMLSSDAAAPVDRPNLSKDYLAGNAPDDWIPLEAGGVLFRERYQTATLDGGCPARSRFAGGSPRRRKFGSVRPLVACNRGRSSSPMDPRGRPGSRSILSGRLRTVAPSSREHRTARKAIILGASFIGLEVAAALRNRGLEVHIVAPDRRPLERILGPDIGQFVQSLHEEHGVIFHLNETAVSIQAK